MKRHSILNKNVTLMLHGIAILMMIYHHIFLNGNTWYIDKSISLLNYLDFLKIGRADTYQQTFAWFCRICVAIFAFTSGYGIYVQYEKLVGNNINIKQMYKYSINRILKFYKKYLLMFVIFVSLEIYTHALIPQDYPSSEFVLSFFGLSYTFNFTWWYVSQYYFMVILSPLFYVLLNKLKLKHYLCIFIFFILTCIIALFTGNLIPYLKFYSKNIQTQLMMFLIIFMEGMFIARFNLVDIISNKINNIVAIIIVILVYTARLLLVRDASDSLFDLVLISPLIICLSKLFNKTKHNRLLMFIGSHSTYMWFVHAYFYAYMFFNLVIKSNQSLFVYIQTVVYSLTTSIVLTLIEKYIDLLLRKLFKKTI